MIFKYTIWPNVHRHMTICAHWTSHFRFSCFNDVIITSTHLRRHSTIDLGVRLWGSNHSAARALVRMHEKAWGAVCISINSSGVQWGYSSVFSVTPSLTNHGFMDLIWCTLSWWNQFGVQLNRNCNARAYNEILYNCVLQTLWQQFGEEPCVDVLERCQQMFSHIQPQFQRSWGVV